MTRQLNNRFNVVLGRIMCCCFASQLKIPVEKRKKFGLNEYFYAQKMGCRKLTYYRNTTTYREASPLKIAYVNREVCPGKKSGFLGAGNSLAQGGGTWDPVTDQRISQLDPRLQGPATQFINQVESELGVQLRVTQGYRSIAEQNAIYAQGRTTPGKKVTWARGGQSYHNYGLAFDVVIMQNGQPVWENLPANIGAIGISLGFEWGGNWSPEKRDPPHFQMTFGQSYKDLQRR